MIPRSTNGCWATAAAGECPDRIISQAIYFTPETFPAGNPRALKTCSAVSMMPWAKPELAQDAAEWLGDAHPLIAQLGSADGLVSMHALAGSLAAHPVQDMASLGGFLRRYHELILFPHELPAIREAFDHASRGHARELLALDKKLSDEPALREFSAASRRVGLAQLQKLRPLRDERVVQRHLAASENGQSHAWHTVVYGLTLAVYSLPVRQGLLGYAQQTTRGFIHAAARPLQATEKECRALFTELCEPFAGKIEALVQSTQAPLACV